MLAVGKIHGLGLICVTGTWLVASGASAAQSEAAASTATLNEIVVMATRRKESIQAAPLPGTLARCWYSMK